MSPLRQAGVRLRLHRQVCGCALVCERWDRQIRWTARKHAHECVSIHRVCGVGDMSKRPFVYYPYPYPDAASSVRCVCMSACACCCARVRIPICKRAVARGNQVNRPDTGSRRRLYLGCVRRTVPRPRAGLRIRCRRRSCPAKFLPPVFRRDQRRKKDYLWWSWWRQDRHESVSERVRGVL